MATHSSILAWEISCTEEPCGLQSMGSQRVRHNLVTELSKAGITDATGGFPGGSVIKNPPANAGDTGPIPGSGRFPGGGHDKPLQYSCLENPMDRGAWRAIIHRVINSRTQLKRLTPTDTTDS